MYAFALVILSAYMAYLVAEVLPPYTLNPTSYHPHGLADGKRAATLWSLLFGLCWCGLPRDGSDLAVVMETDPCQGCLMRRCAA